MTWQLWDETGEDVWVHTQATVRAGSEILTMSLKGCHPFAAKSGATLFDAERVVDLGPWTWQAVLQVAQLLFDTQ